MTGPQPVGGPPPRGPRRVPERAGINRTRAELIAGAARAFAEHGLRGSTMQAIAAAAGVSKATLYNHFRTKDEVARTLLSVELDRLAAVAAGLPLDQALAALADECAGHLVLRRIAQTEPHLLAGLLGVATDRWAEITERLAEALGVGEEEAELAARWLVGVAMQPGRSGLRHRSATRLAAVLLQPDGSGLTPPEGSG